MTALSVATGAAGSGGGRQGWIAFAGVHWTAEGDPAGSQLYVVRADGTGLRRITSPAAREDTAPAWSPDGRRIAFGRREGKTWRLYVVNADGSGVRPLTRPQPFADTPSWSPSGNALAFAALPSGLPRRGSYAQQVFVLSLRTGRARQLTGFAAFPGGASSPSWSPDGRRILFSARTSAAEKARPDLWVIGPTGSGLRRLVANAVDPSWSPDGREIAFVRRGDVWTAGADGAGVRRVARTRDVESGPTWSPDGARIAVARDYAPKDWRRETRRVFVTTANGKGLHALTPADPRFWADAPAWQPSGAP